MKITEKIYIAILIVGVNVIAGVGYSQWNFSLSYDQEYNDNPFRLPEAQNSWISTLDAQIEKGFNKLNIGYYGTFSRFNSIKQRDYYWHQLAFWSGSDTTSWGAYAEQRINRSDYNIYDYLNLTAYFQRRWTLAGMVANLRSSILVNRFNQLAELNNWKFNTNINFHKSLPTRTTIMGGVGFGYKKYFQSPQQELIVSESIPASAQILSSAVVSGGSGNGSGNGRGSGMGNGNRRGRGWLTENYYENFAATTSVSQLTFWGRLAQSVTRTTGLALHYQTHHLMTGLDRFLSGLGYSYNQESQLFDDQMGYEGYSLGTELTQLLPLSMTLKLAAYYSIKNYSAQGIYLNQQDYDATILREDSYKTAWVSLRKNIDINFRDGARLVMGVYYQWLDNQSNSYWYDYKSSAASVAMEFEF